MKIFVSSSLTIRNALYYLQVRFYKGKYLTSYQQKVSSEERRRSPMELNTEPVQIVVEQSIKDRFVLTPELPKKEDDIVEVYRSSTDEYRKMIFYGSENKTVTRSDFYCHGCGSILNCSSINNPGYIPFEIYSQNCDNKEFMKSIICIRCFYLENDLDPFDVSLDEKVYDDLVLKKLKEESSATIILLADMTDLPWSIPSNLQQFCLPHIRLIVVGNKVDLLPQQSKFKEGYKTHLIKAAEQRGISPESIYFTELLSATDCSGIDTLIDRIISPKFYKNEPIYLIGSTNVGKSTIFNRFLKSDLCKTIAKTQVKESLISNWPGTTLNVLRFPMVNQSSALLARRISAKSALTRGDIKSAVDAKCNLIDSGQILEQKRMNQDPQQLTTYSYVGGSIKASCFDEKQLMMMNEEEEGDEYEEAKITTKKWCYDTPGLINPDQLISYLPRTAVTSLTDHSSMIRQPTILVLRPGLSLLMENLARLDVVKCSPGGGPVYLVCHCVLPAEIVDTDDVDRYLRENEHITHYKFRNHLPDPLIDRLRSKVPSDQDMTMVPVDMDFETTGFNESVGDVVLSSIGWVGVSGPEGAVVKVTAWTPAGIGLCQRTPSMVPTAVRSRGRRKAHSREFTVNNR